METNKINTQDTLEANLLEVIQRHLPAAERERLDYLLEKNEGFGLTEAEQKELLQFADKIESQGAERARALVKLAQLRNVEPEILLDELFPLEMIDNRGASRWLNPKD